MKGGSRKEGRLEDRRCREGDSYCGRKEGRTEGRQEKG